MVNDAKFIADNTVIMATAIEDVCTTLLKMLDYSDKYAEGRKFIEAMKKETETPIMEIMDSSMSKRYCEILEKSSIPYIRYEMVGTAKDVLLLAPSDKHSAIAIENGLRIHSGLAIYTKYEMDRAMAVMYPGAKEQRYDGLSIVQAECVVQMAKDLKNPVTVVYEKQPDETYSLFCHGKHAQTINRLVLYTLCNEANHSKEMKDAIQSHVYFQKNKEAFSDNVEFTRINNQSFESYLFSYSNQNEYIHIKEDGFDMIRNDKTIKSMSISDNPTLYPDVLKFIGNCIEKPIYRTAAEILNLGGISAVNRQAEKEITCKEPEKIFNRNMALKTWVAEKLMIGDNVAFNIAGSNRLYIEEFIKECSLSNNARSFVETYKDIYQKELDEIVYKLAKISTQKEEVRITTEDFLSRSKIKISDTKKEQKLSIDKYRNTMYSTKIVSEIRNNGMIVYDSKNGQAVNIGYETPDTHKKASVEREELQYEVR